MPKKYGVYPAPKKSGAGFTLIELLVVISIIAILTVIGITIFTNIQKGTRDAKRKADLDAIAKAYAANYVYGVDSPYPAPKPEWFATGIPKDPKDHTDYFWNGSQSIPTQATSTFTICAGLENGYGNSKKDDFSELASGQEAIFYCLKSQQ